MALLLKKDRPAAHRLAAKLEAEYGTLNTDDKKAILASVNRKDEAIAAALSDLWGLKLAAA